MSQTCYDKELRAHLPRNFFSVSVEGGLYMAGLTFIARDTILPPMIKSLGGPVWLVSLAPILTMAGISWPSIFVVHWIETWHWKKPYLMVTGALQRLPMLFAALALFYLMEWPLLTLALVAVAPLISGFFCGVSFPAWLELVAKTIPASRRASVFAVRLIIASTVGLVAGIVISRVLEAYPGAAGYGVLHLIAFLFLVLSYIVFAFIKETDLPSKPASEALNLGESLREIPGILRNDKQLTYFILCRFFRSGVFIAIPFLPLHALAVSGRPESFLGSLVIATVLGAVCGNILAGHIGDRLGGKFGMALALLTYIFLFLLALGAKSEYWFYILFFFSGFSRDCAMVSGSTLSIELCPEDRRAKYMAIIMFFLLPGMLMGSLGGALLWALFDNFSVVALAAVLSVVCSLFFLLKIKEPRFINS